MEAAGFSQFSSAQPTAFACGAVDACPGLIAAGLVKWLPLTATYTAYRSKAVNTPSAAAVKISHISPNSLKSSSSLAPSERRPEKWKKKRKITWILYLGHAFVTSVFLTNNPPAKTHVKGSAHSPFLFLHCCTFYTSSP